MKFFAKLEKNWNNLLKRSTKRWLIWKKNLFLIILKKLKIIIIRIEKLIKKFSFKDIKKKN